MFVSNEEETRQKNYCKTPLTISFKYLNQKTCQEKEKPRFIGEGLVPTSKAETYVSSHVWKD